MVATPVGVISTATLAAACIGNGVRQAVRSQGPQVTDATSLTHGCTCMACGRAGGVGDVPPRSHVPEPRSTRALNRPHFRAQESSTAQDALVSSKGPYALAPLDINSGSDVQLERALQRINKFPSSVARRIISGNDWQRLERGERG